MRSYYERRTITQKLEIGVYQDYQFNESKKHIVCTAVRHTGYKIELENRKDFVLDCLNTIQYRKLSCLTYRSTLLKSNILMTLNKVNRCTMMFFL